MLYPAIPLNDGKTKENLARHIITKPTCSVQHRWRTKHINQKEYDSVSRYPLSYVDWIQDTDHLKGFILETLHIIPLSFHKYLYHLSNTPLLKGDFGHLDKATITIASFWKHGFYLTCAYKFIIKAQIKRK